ncbi:unnamed protein product [Triticum turgidum subsp. durum]|uniref:CCHC-type domain-containing protein n=1 Tax=Triticum turgidum subsp. durum TaxID=4567 RepID=A0A9R1RND6_TRITD|nr:unnamed protein product [Triticum turgidum subsp. durum]
MLLPSALPGDPSGPGDVVMPVTVQGAPNALAAASQCSLQLVPITPLAPLQTSTTSPTAAALAADALAWRRSDPAISGLMAGARPNCGRGLQATTPAPLATGQLPSSPVSTPTPLTGPGQVAAPVLSGWGDWLGCFGRKTTSADPMCCAPTAREETLGDWHLVTGRRRSPSSNAFRRPGSNARMAPPAWLRDRCFRCLSKGHHAHSCRDPIRCSGCLRFGHKVRFCHAQHRSDLTTKPCDDAAKPNPAPASEVDATPVDVQLQPVLAEETELLRTELRDCLARVESVLGRAEAALAKLEVVPAVSLLPELQIGSPVGEEASLYGHFSPHATSCSPMSVLLTGPGCVVIDEVMAPVLEIMPELQERCGEPTSPLSMVLPKEMGQVMSVGGEVDEVGALAPISGAQLQGLPLPCVQLKAPESIVSVVPVAEHVNAVVSVRDKVDEILFEIQVSSLLARLEAVSPGSDKMIVEKALRSKTK